MNKTYNKILEYINTLPVIESHQHNSGETNSNADSIHLYRQGYTESDFRSASFDMSETDHKKIMDKSLSIEERYPLLEKIIPRYKHTAYAKGIMLGLEASWGIKDLSLDSFLYWQDCIDNRRNEEKFYQLINAHNIKASIVHNCETDYMYHNKYAATTTKNVINMYPLHNFHNKSSFDNEIKRMNYNDSLTRDKVVSFDGYLELMKKYIKSCVDFGCVGMKDQLAYEKTLEITLPEKSQAEKIFNKMIFNPRNILSSEESYILSDYLFHQLILLARKHNLVVQLHTGHMAGIRNEIRKTNAVKLTPILELYQDVMFDLFHGNWPYMGEFLFLGKNYPNVRMDLCWVHAIDPYYTVELMKRLIQTVPQNKVFAFGGDAHYIEATIGYLIQAKQNTALAFSEMIEAGLLSFEDAKITTKAWFFDNINETFKLNL